MKRSLLICAALMTLLSVSQVQADDVQLTLDLKNATAGNAASGGTWELYARKVETGSGAQGDTGISGIRALINDIDVAVTFAAGINQNITCNGGPCVQDLGGTVEIVYGQDISSGGVVNGVGVLTPATADVLIASGTWPAGPTRPTFGDDGATPTPFTSESNFLGGSTAPYPASVLATTTATTVVTLGDINASNTADLADIQPFVDIIGGAPYNPAADIDQNGVADLADIQPFVDLLAGVPLTASVGAVPEPASLMLMLVSAAGLVGRRRVL